MTAVPTSSREFCVPSIGRGFGDSWSQQATSGLCWKPDFRRRLFFPTFDPDNEGHGGWTNLDIADHIYGWLQANPADIILLHIGTNSLLSPEDVEVILDAIDRYERDYGVSIPVFLARIINRSDNLLATTEFNDFVENMALDRVTNSANPHYPDKIVMVDMEEGAGIDYSIDTTSPYNHGDMYDDLHPNDSGYTKMAQKWFSSLQTYLGAAARGSITIINTTSPPSGEVFTFTGDLGTFSLSNSLSQTFSGLEARNFKVLESPPSGWSLQSTVCTGGDSTPISDGVTVHLGPAQNITCTFTNGLWTQGASGSYLDNGSGNPIRFSFLDGSLNSIEFNDAIDALVLNNGSAGSYTSQVFDGGEGAHWGSIEWMSNIGELPDEGMSDESVDLLGNVLLFHLNKDATQGETNVVVHDFSGRQHTGTAFGAGVSIGAADSGKFKGRLHRQMAPTTAATSRWPSRRTSILQRTTPTASPFSCGSIRAACAIRPTTTTRSWPRASAPTTPSTPGG